MFALLSVGDELLEFRVNVRHGHGRAKPSVHLMVKGQKIFHTPDNRAVVVQVAVVQRRGLFYFFATRIFKFDDIRLVPRDGDRLFGGIFDNVTRQVLRMPKFVKDFPRVERDGSRRDCERLSAELRGKCIRV